MKVHSSTFHHSEFLRLIWACVMCSAAGHGLSSVIENVESSLGLPKPEELTDQEKREQEFIVTSDEQGDETKDTKEDEDRPEERRDPDKGDEIERDGDRQEEDENKEQGNPSQGNSLVQWHWTYWLLLTGELT